MLLVKLMTHHLLQVSDSKLPTFLACQLFNQCLRKNTKQTVRNRKLCFHEMTQLLLTIDASWRLAVRSLCAELASSLENANCSCNSVACKTQSWHTDEVKKWLKQKSKDLYCITLIQTYSAHKNWLHSTGALEAILHWSGKKRWSGAAKNGGLGVSLARWRSRAPSLAHIAYTKHAQLMNQKMAEILVSLKPDLPDLFQHPCSTCTP